MTAPDPAVVPVPRWQAALALRLYTTLLRAATPLYLLKLWWRGRQEPPYRQHLRERLGGRDGAITPGALWLHAVSLGETRAAAALLDALRSQRPGLRVLLTHGTATGRSAGAALLRPGDTQAWLPFDTPGAVRRFLRHHRPALGVLMETEVWPVLLAECERAGVDVVLANARLSPKSAAQGLRLRALLQPAAARFSAVLAQTEADAQRLLAAGARRVQVMGNLKFDMAPPPALLQRGRAWRHVVADADPAQAGRRSAAPVCHQTDAAGAAPDRGAALPAADSCQTGGRALVLAASTREGEETPLLQAWAAVPVPRPLLLLVPRHPQRFDAVAAQVQAAGLTLARRSAWHDRPPPAAAAADVWLGDSVGEMPLYYAAADVALLGGSFAPLGGQNLIEAAACGCPLVMGPSTFNFELAAELALQAGAALRVDSIASGVTRAVALATDPARAEVSQRAFAFAATHRGAAVRMAAAVLERLAPA